MQDRQQTAVSGEYDAATIAREMVDVAVDKKAGDVTLIDIRQVTTLADFFVLATGTSERQLNAISSGIQDRMDERQVALFRVEGVPADGWILLDYGQIIVHIFAPEQRAYYDLERRWKDAPTVVRIQ
jgi:ribosome-associated protein